MSVFDLIILVIALGFALRGAMRGMVSQIVSVGSLFVCWIVASRFAFIFAPSIPAEAPWNKIGAMAVLFVVTMLVIWFLRERLEKKLKDWKLERLNLFLGAALGFVKGLALCLILTFFCVTLCETTRTMVFQSKSGKFLTASITKIGAFVPKDSSELLQAQLDLFNAKVSGMEKAEPFPEADPLQKILNDTKLSIADGQQGFGKVLTRSNELLQEAKRLQDELDEQTNKAVSLFDAVGKFFWGEKTTEKKVETPVKETAGTSVIQTESSAALFPVHEQPPQHSPFNLPSKESATFISEFPDKVQPNSVTKPVQPIPLISKSAPAYLEDTFFTRPAATEPNVENKVDNMAEQNYVPPKMQELTALLPSSVIQPKIEETGTIEQTIMLPSSATSFRLSHIPVNTPAESPQYLSPTSRATGTPATLFSPRR